ncbi:MAG TPA: EthD family reductase [Candidatus Acidoferrum sp.]|nr:EthD family reductase [Candidatus Acidoferrum sp.]
MVTAIAMYPANAPFDRTYYHEKHMPLVHAKLEQHGLKKTEVHVIGGTAAGGPSPYHVITKLYFDDETTMKNAFGTPDFAAVVEDIKNFYGGDTQLLTAIVAT